MLWTTSYSSSVSSMIQRLKWNSLTAYLQEETYPDLLSFIKFCTRKSTSQYRTISHHLHIQLSLEDTIQDSTCHQSELTLINIASFRTQ